MRVRCIVLSVGLFLLAVISPVSADFTFEGVTMQGVALTAPELFVCGTSTVDDADGNTYNTVLIGTQCWMATNMNLGTMITAGNVPSNDSTVEKWCNGRDSVSAFDFHTTSNEAACDGTGGNPNYGGLYTWDEAVGCPAAGCADDAAAAGAQGICPTDWHVPTDAEFKILEGNVDATYGVGDPEWDGTSGRGDDAGTQLKTGGTSGLEVLQSGLRLTSGDFAARSLNTSFWTSSVSGSNAWRRCLSTSATTVCRDSSQSQANGFSVRCLKD